MQTGTYTGNGHNVYQDIQVEFTPTCVMVSITNDGSTTSSAPCLIALQGSPIVDISYTGGNAIEIINGGFRVYGKANIFQNKFNYIAFG